MINLPFEQVIRQDLEHLLYIRKYLSNTQYIIIASSPEPLLQGTLQNGTPEVRALGIKDLFAETSRNLTAGLTFGNGSNFSGSVDFYSINVDDRIIFFSHFW